MNTKDAINLARRRVERANNSLTNAAAELGDVRLSHNPTYPFSSGAFFRAEAAYQAARAAVSDAEWSLQLLLDAEKERSAQ